MMKIIQISDIHIFLEEANYNNADSKENFLRLLKLISRQDFDYLVISGDLAFRSGGEKIYQWLKKNLTAYQAKLRVISGNHDDSKQLFNAFPLPQNSISVTTESKVYYYEKLANNHIFYLDTADGILDQDQREWIREVKNKCQIAAVNIFMHHPPLKMGINYMDQNYPLKNQQEAKELFKIFTNCNVFCGHYHNQAFRKEDNLNVYLTPSSWFQISKEPSEFSIQNTIPAYRYLEIENNQLLQTEVVFWEE